MDFDTNIEIIEETEISIEVLLKSISNFIEENPNIKSIHRIYLDELTDFINKKL